MTVDPTAPRHLVARLIAALVVVCTAGALLAPPVEAATTSTLTTGRVAGANRVETAVELSRYEFAGGASEVYLARSDVFADAVAAGSLTDGPVLLVPGCGRVPAPVLAEIERLDPGRVVALGGPAAVCADVLREAGSGRAMTRMSGANRVETAVELSRYEFAGGASEVYLARSDVFADAVAAGSLTDGPVLLVPGCGRVPAPVLAEIERLDPGRVVALGGPAAVCADVLREAGSGRAMTRMSGANRVETAVQLSRYEFAGGASEVYLARSDVFADAVAAGSLTDGPVLLVPGCGRVPAPVLAEIERLDPGRVVALGGPAAVCSDVLREIAGTPDAACGPGYVDGLGAASTASPVVSATLSGGRNFVVTRGLVPPVLGAFDPVSRQVTDTVELPSGQGAWASTAATERDLYVGTYNPADLYHVDTRTMKATRVAGFPEARYIHGLTTAPDGTIFVGTLPDGAVYEYDPETGDATSLGTAYPGEYAVRSIAATADTVYAGVGSHAHLMAIDRETHERHDILPEELEDQSFVYTLQASDEWLVAGTEPDGRLAVLNLADPTDYRVLPDLGERTVDAIAIHGDDVYFTGRTTGTVYHYRIDTDTVQALGIPVAREETRGLFREGRSLIGTGGTGAVWRYNLDTGDVEVTDLASAGLPGGPEPVHSLTGFGGTAYVGGHWGIQVHAGNGAPAGRLRIPGEPKAMVDVRGTLYAALYPSGELWRYRPEDERPQHVATIGHDQARPRDMDFDPSSGKLLVASQSDYGLQGGALSVFEPTTGHLSVHRDVVEDQSVRSVGGAGNLAYIGTELRGGGGATPAEGSARLAAWDLTAGRKLWEVAPVPGATAIVDVVAAHGTVYGLTAQGVVFALNAESRTVGKTVTLASTGRALMAKNGVLYATSTAGLHRIDPDTMEKSTVVRGAGYAHLANGPNCSLYVARGMDLFHTVPGANEPLSPQFFGPEPPEAVRMTDLDH